MKLSTGRRIDDVCDTAPKRTLGVHSWLRRAITTPKPHPGLRFSRIPSTIGADSPGFASSEPRVAASDAAARRRAAPTV